MIHDQTFIGTSNDDIHLGAPKNQWELHELVTNGHQLEASTHSALKITSYKLNETSISLVLKSGWYSHKSKTQPQQSHKQHMH